MKPSEEQKNPVGKVINRPIVDEIRASYLDYAMSVIISRALPDVRDGLKPVQRRILYAMWSLGLRSTARFRKSATVVGEVLGKYHPHGDAAVYDAMARMAQDFSLRAPLVFGQGNFGSIDGDPPAAMRYTEAKLHRISEELLYDLDKETVDFAPNYDATLKEPTVLPGKLPNLLLNGATGIAVGMATNIPPHNITELCDALSWLIEHPEAEIEDLMRFIKGPDFPTGATIFNKKDIKEAYATGRGAIVTRANAEIVETKGGFRIIVSEIPYMVNKAALLEKIAELVHEKRIEGIKDLRDESSKNEIRIVIELKKEAFPKKILNQLYKYTQLQTTFHVNLLALVDGIQPRTLTLKMILEEYIKHRQIVVKKRTEYDLNRAKDRAHILEGLVMALEDIDKIIATIKKSSDREDAKINLISRFKFSERQAVAILEMRLQQLANLERIKVEEELKEKRKLIKELTDLLGNPKKILKVIQDELGDIKERFDSPRKTKIITGAVGEFSQEDLIPNEDTIVILTADGYIKRLEPETFHSQGRGGKGILGLTTKEEDIVTHFFSTMTHNDLLFFTSKGRVFQLKAYEVPVSSRTAKGQSIVNFLQLSPEEKIYSILQVTNLSTFPHLIMVTSHGVIKKVNSLAFQSVRRNGLIAITLKEGDQLRWVAPSTGEDEIILITAKGQSIRFREKLLREMGRNAAGVRAMRLKRGDNVVGMDLIGKNDKKDTMLFILMEEGFGKNTEISEYKSQGRGGSGIKTAKVTKKTGEIVSGEILRDLSGDAIIISKKGQVIRLPLSSIPSLGRATQGVRLMRFKQEKDSIASVTFVEHSKEEE